MSRRSWIAAGAGIGVAALVAVAVVVVVRGGSGPAERTATAYLAAWERFDVAAMAELVDRPDEQGPAVLAMRDRLGVTEASFRAGSQRREGEEVEAHFTARLELAGLGEWRYDGLLRLVRQEDRWVVAWSPSALHPSLSPSQELDATRTWPERAPILGSDGAPLVATGDVIVVGLQPGRIGDQGEVERVLERLLQVAPERVRAALAQPWVRPDLFVPVVEVRPERLAAVRAELEPVPGVFFQRGRNRVAATDDFAAHVLGDVGEVTAERLDELGAPYVVGDRVGLSGMEAVHERRLAGAPSGEVRVVETGGGTVVQVLHRFPGAPPEPVRLTLDRGVQQAAEQALSEVREPSALVALDVGTGEVRAVVSRPVSEFNRGLAGQYPPGSTFKVVTTAALLAAGVRPTDTVPCPPEASVGGRTFVNFESGALGPVPFSTAFAQSCNTAFVSLSPRVSGQALADAAASFGFGRSYEVGLPVGGGRFPAPEDEVEQAAASIGQGRVVASPVHLATVAAAVASGTWRPPRLQAGGAAPEGAALDPTVTATLRQLMTAVVREGTGTAAARPGQEIAGKTGTAEFGAGDPPPTHAWFIGFRGPLAFAVLVEGGSAGGRVAAPVAGRFLDALPS